VNTKQIARLIAIAGTLLALAGCGIGKPKSDVAVVDVSRIVANWPKFANYNNQIQADSFAIEQSRAPESQKARQRAELQQRYLQFQNDIAADITGAAQQVASDKKLKMVFTRQGVGYGGTDITVDVEKILKIEERATPKP
jgi:Skp family chaperone for outer membrane proteins